MRALRALLTLSAFGALAAGCGSTEEAAKVEAALAHAGPWDIPADVARVGDTQYVSYTGAGPWVGPSGCSGNLTTGAGRLRDFLAASFPQVSHIGGYSCRSINGDSSTMSVHGTGRALDVHIPLDGGEADNDQGDPVAHWLIRHAEEIGIQYIIWDRWSWNASRPAGTKERSYGGAHPHHDHLHVELSVAGGRASTPWFSGPMEPPDGTGCEPIPRDGGVVEETSACFVAHGPSTYWRRESVGHGGSLLWTNAFQSETPSNWARWTLETSARADYAVEVWIEPAFAEHRTARYAVRHDGTVHTVVVDLAAAPRGWLRLGVFPFAAGGGQHLSVYDDEDGPVPANQHIPADAVRLVRVEPAPMPTPEPTPPPEPTPEPTPAPAPSALASAAILSVTLEPEVPAFSPIDPLPGGDPRLDDDPLVAPDPEADRTLRGGCSASRRRGACPIWLVVSSLLVISAGRAARASSRRRGSRPRTSR